MSTTQQERAEVPDLIPSQEWYQRGGGGPPGEGHDKKGGPSPLRGCSAPEGIKKKKALRKKEKKPVKGGRGPNGTLSRSQARELRATLARIGLDPNIFMDILGGGDDEDEDEDEKTAN
ncbi:hypothetical protein ACHAPE_002618 [Trichoderma viride]